jgi:hypothetical protein
MFDAGDQDAHFRRWRVAMLIISDEARPNGMQSLAVTRHGLHAPLACTDPSRPTIPFAPAAPHAPLALTIEANAVAHRALRSVRSSSGRKNQQRSCRCKVRPRRPHDPLKHKSAATARRPRVRSWETFVRLWHPKPVTEPERPRSRAQPGRADVRS